MISTLEITVQRAVDGTWPVVAEYHRAGQLLPVRSEGELKLTGEPGSSLPAKYGRALGEALFTGPIRDAFVATRGVAVRIWLCIEDPELRTWRWEWLRAPVDAHHWDFLSLDQRALYSLYLPSLTDRSYPPIGRRDLRALVVVASPADPGNQYRLAAFDSAMHVARLRNALGGRMPCDVLARSEGAVGLPNLYSLVMRLTSGSPSGPYTVLHIVCHGWLNPEDSETRLYFEQTADADGLVLPQPVKAAEFIEQLRHVRQLPHLVFLSVCESSAPEAEQRLGGLAQRLVRELGIPAVIGMTEPVTIVTAQALSEAFYTRLLNQENEGAADRALVEAYAGLAQRLDVHVPALYSRLGPHPLFNNEVDRELQSGEIRDGLQKLDSLLAERAPILQAELAAHSEALEPLLDAPDTSDKNIQQKREAILRKINEICQEALDLSFHEFVAGKPLLAYDSRQPFRGLSPFRLEDREFFFGRDVLVETLARKLDEDPFLPVLGPSGSGKSSLVLAGLVPLLQKRNSQLQVAYLTPGRAPCEQLRAVRVPLNDGPVLYVVDQFEEIFTLCSDEAQRREFVRTLLELVNRDLLVLTMRADFWGECARYADLKTRMQARQELISSMTTFELRAAMDRQAAEVGLRFEADLSYTMLHEVAGEPGAMPLLQHALLELWKRRHGRWLRAGEYRAIGGVKHAIAETADQLYSELALTDQEQMRDIFLRLTQLDEQGSLGEEKRDTRRRVPFSDLVPAQSEPENTKALVKRLADAVLVVTSRNRVTNQDEVEVAHEALIRHWSRLRGWLDEDRDGQRLRRNIEDAAREWNKTPTDETLLVHQGSRLDAALSLRDKGRFPLTDVERRYVEACIKLREKRLRERKAKALGLRIAAALAALLLIIGTWGWREQGLRVEQEHVAEARRLVQLANSVGDPESDDQELSALLALRAQHVKPSVEGDQVLRQSLGALPRKVLVDSAPENVTDVALNKDGTTRAFITGNTIKVWKEGQWYEMVEPGVTSLALDAAGQSLALVKGSTVTVIDILRWPSQIPVPLKTLRPVKSIAFSPDGRLLAVTDGEGARCVRLGSISPDVVSLPIHADIQVDPVERIVVSNDEIVLLIYSSKVERWHAPSRKLVNWYSAQFYGYVASPDGRWVAGLDIDDDSSLVVLDAKTGVEEYRLRDPKAFRDANFSVDGKFLITLMVSRKVEGKLLLKIWDIRAGTDLGGSLLIDTTVRKWVGAGDGTVAFISEETGKAITFWNISPRPALLTVPVAPPEPTSLREQFFNLAPPTVPRPMAMALNGSGDKLAFALNGTVSIWDVENETSPVEFKYDERGYLGSDYSANYYVGVALSPRGESVAVATERLLQVFDLQREGEAKSITILPGSRIMYSADGKSLAAPRGESIVLLDRNLSELSSVPALREGYLGDRPPLSPNGNFYAYRSKDGLTIIDLMAKRSKLLLKTDEQSIIWDLAFSEDDRFLVAAVGYERAGGKLLVWRTDSFNPVAEIIQHRGTFNVEGVSITGDGQYVSVAYGNSVSVWNVSDSSQAANLSFKRRSFNDDALKTVFSADGRRAAVFTTKGISVIALLREGLERQACKLLSRNLTSDEWKLYVGKGERQKVCANLP